MDGTDEDTDADEEEGEDEEEENGEDEENTDDESEPATGNPVTKPPGFPPSDDEETSYDGPPVDQNETVSTEEVIDR